MDFRRLAAYRLSGIALFCRELIRKRKYVEILLGRFSEKYRPVTTVSAFPDDRRKQRQSKKDARTFKRICNQIFDEFERDDTHSRRVLRRLPPIVPIGCGGFDQALMDLPSLQHWLYANPETVPVEKFTKSLNGCILGNVVDEDDDTPIKGEWYVLKLRTVGAEALRGKTKLVLPWAAIATYVFQWRGKIYEREFLWLSPDGREWRQVDANGDLTPKSEDMSRKVARLHMSANISRDVTWRLVIRRGGVAFEFWCDAAGVRELMVLRDADMGRRRAAIKHHVKQHMRRLSDGREVPVRAHLRGKEECKWGRWTIEIYPSKHDIEHLETQRVLPSTDIGKLLIANTGR